MGYGEFQVSKQSELFLSDKETFIHKEEADVAGRRHLKEIGRVSMMLLLALCIGVQWIASQEILPDEEPLPPDEPSHMPGRVEGTGTHFEITDSEYLNVTLESSEEIGLTLESVPQMVLMK